MRMRWPFGNTQDVKCSSNSIGNVSPATRSSGSRAECLCVPLNAAPATCVTCPSGDTSEMRSTQLARGTLADTVSFATGRPRISSADSSGALS